MKTHVIIDYGLYVTAADLEVYAEKNEFDAFDLLMDIGNYYSDADGECTLYLDEEGSFKCDDSFSILSLDRFPTLFEQAYESKESALCELKEKYAEYLPEDFNYESKFVCFVGTIFG
jgi:hypothetical protein